jgi:glycine hydroxymethyltransferase
VTNGIRIGTPAITTSGFDANDARLTASLVGDARTEARVREQVARLCARCPVYRGL